MTSNEKLIQTIFNELKYDDEPLEKKGDRLKHLYNKASETHKQVMNEMLIALTGWSLPTLINRSQDFEESKANI